MRGWRLMVHFSSRRFDIGTILLGCQQVFEAIAVADEKVRFLAKPPRS